MLTSIEQFLEILVAQVWGLPLALLLVGTGVVFTFLLGGRSGAIQLRGFRHAIAVVRGRYDDPSDPGQISHFQALCTALSATVGLGNIAGVAIAMHLGGPGAAFWMIMTGFVGMATKYAECTLAVKYRRISADGIVHGGPMHYIELGLGKKWKPLALFFAFAVTMGCFGAANMFQANQVAAILKLNFGIEPLTTGIVLSVLTALVIIGGIKRIGAVASLLVPAMGLIYVGGALVVIALHLELVPHMLYTIVHDAFTGSALAGGAAGIGVQQALIQGIRRACFSNEAGLGSAPIAHAAAATKEPVREGVVALLEPFVDTVVICTMTAVVILISGVWTQDLSGVALTAAAFDSVMPGFGTWFVPVAVSLFAYSTLISWSYYGERGVDYLFGERAVLPFKLVFCVLTVVGAVWTLGPVLAFSDLMLGLMAIPNLIALWLLMPVVKRETESYFERLAKGEFK